MGRLLGIRRHHAIGRWLWPRGPALHPPEVHSDNSLRGLLKSARVWD